MGAGTGLWPQQLTGSCLCHPAYQLALPAPGPDVSGLWTQIPFMWPAQWLSVSLELLRHRLARGMLGKCQANDRVHPLRPLPPFRLTGKPPSSSRKWGHCKHRCWLAALGPLFIVHQPWALGTGSANIYWEAHNAQELPSSGSRVEGGGRLSPQHQLVDWGPSGEAQAQPAVGEGEQSWQQRT